MVMEYGGGMEVIHILASGSMVKLKDTEYMYGKIRINMKANGARI